MTSRMGGLQELESIERQFENAPTADRIKALGEFILDTPSATLGQIADPFGPDYYSAVTRLWSEIAKRPDYDPQRDELAPYLEQASALGPVPSKNAVSSRFAGEQWQGIGHIMQRLDMMPGQSLLEYGPGQGQIALQMAKLGCEVAVIDVEPRYLRMIEEQAAALKLDILTQQGVFGDAFGTGRRFDRILFFEAFHHALEHASVLEQLHSLLKPDGFIVFACEPVILPNGPWDKVVPFPWGPRLDGLSVHAMKTYGWCELGFRRDYFIDLLIRSGYVVSFHPCQATDFGSCFVARSYTDKINMGDPFLIEVSGHDAGWHEPESGLRYTREHALFPLNQRTPAASITVDFFNYIPIPRRIKITIGSRIETFGLDGGQAKLVSFMIEESASYLSIETRTDSLAPYVGPHDQRKVGVGVRSITYERR